jgi:hypothetical protein
MGPKAENFSLAVSIFSLKSLRPGKVRAIPVKCFPASEILSRFYAIGRVMQNQVASRHLLKHNKVIHVPVKDPPAVVIEKIPKISRKARQEKCRS